MRFFAAILLFSTAAIAQEGIPSKVGTGKMPPGLAGVTDLHAIEKSQIDALSECAEVLRGRYQRGLVSINTLMDAETRLCLARLETTSVKQERLDIIQEALVHALTTWQRINELKQVNARGGEADAETQARAEVYRYRVMWLKEKARESK